MSQRAVEPNDLPRRVLLCMHQECYGSFYLPLDYDESPTCPVDARHDVAVYGGLTTYHYCEECGNEIGLSRAGRDLCRSCEIKALADA